MNLINVYLLMGVSTALGYFVAILMVSDKLMRVEELEEQLDALRAKTDDKKKIKDWK